MGGETLYDGRVAVEAGSEQVERGSARDVEPVAAFDALSLHRRELATRGRCPYCAEHVGAVEVLRGKPCSRCGTSLAYTGLGSPDAIIARLNEQWGRWRYVAFPLIAAATAVAGVVPLLGGIVRLAAMVLIHVVFVRRPLLWLSMKRRIAAKITLRLYLLALALLGLLIDAIVAPFLGVNALVTGVTSVVVAVLYAEGSLAFICARMRQESRGAPLALWEWAVPGALLFILLGAAAALVAAIAAMVNVVAVLPELIAYLWGSK